MSRTAQHKKSVNLTALPPIPDKRYFTIGEVSQLCDLEPHVLRYWEQEFRSLAPTKRSGNRRYYQRQDVLLIRKIKDLLHNQGFTIKGARAQLTRGGQGEVEAQQRMTHQTTQDLLSELHGVLDLLDS